MKRHRSLRVQVTVAVAAIVAGTVAAAGLTISWRIGHQDRAQVDAILEDQADKIVEDVGKDPATAIDGDKTGQPADDSLLAGSSTLVRLVSDAFVIDQRGPAPSATIPIPDTTGFSEVVIDGQAWRSLVRDVDTMPGARVQLLQDLTPVEQRLHDIRVLVWSVTALAPVVAALIAWAIAGRMMRPLQQLRSAARSIRPPIDTYRLPEPANPIEVSELAVTLNNMLARLETSMRATRQFAADAGHELRTPLTALGVDLETMREHPELAPGQQQAMLEAMAVQHERLSDLLDGLLALARGDAEALPTTTAIDLADLLERTVERAQSRHPTIGISLTERVEDPKINGWPEGLRLAIDNLIDNAARHGRPHGRVDITVDRQVDGSITIEVVDDGPGIPADELGIVTQRFSRGHATRAPGFGLGLPIVQQQAQLHGGDLTLAAAPTQGLSATISLRDAERR